MGRSLLKDAFAHHVWATLQLMDACLALSAEQLETSVPGTYGSILALTALGVEPPDIDVWAFGQQAGLIVETPPTS